MLNGDCSLTRPAHPGSCLLEGSGYVFRSYSRSSVNRNGRVWLAAVLVFLVLCTSPTVSSIAVAAAVQRTTAGGRTAAVVKESSSRAIAVTAIRNLGEEAWLERLEIEVKNLTTKPVSYLLILVVFLDVKRAGPDGVSHPQVMLLTYGRGDLLRDGKVATADDIPIEPGESYVFRLPEGDRKVLESDLAAGIVPESAVKRFVISVDSVSFGDGTGFKSGRPFSTNRRSSAMTTT